jgi:Rieske Fe-S protein
MDMKKILLIIVLIIAGYLIWKFIPGPLVQAPVVESTPAVTTTISGAVKNTNGDFVYKNEGEYATVEIEYPVSASAKMQVVMENWIKERITYFSPSNTDMFDAREMARLKADGRKYAMDIEYKKYSGSTTVSYVYQIYEDTGGAHPNTYYKTFTFDASGNTIELAGLFKTDVRYLDRLSKISYDYLVKDLAKRFSAPLDDGQIDMVRMGTSPTPETLQFFYVDEQNLVLIFPPYQVAAYAAGVSEVRIPLSDLKDILK